MTRTLLLITLGLGGCSAEAEGLPEQSWRFAQAHADCAPWDGAATTIELSDSPIGQQMTAPWLHISVYRGIGSNAGRSEIKGMESGGMSATWCTTADDCTSADQGWADLTPNAGTLDGQYQLHFPDGRAVSGKFTAQVVALRIMCG